MKYHTEEIVLDFSVGTEYAQLKKYLAYTNKIVKKFHVAIPYILAKRWASREEHDFRYLSDGKIQGMYVINYNTQTESFSVYHIGRLSVCEMYSKSGNLERKEYNFLKRKFLELRDNFLY